MNNQFKMPSCEEVRRAYKIPVEQEVRIEQLDSLPDPGWVKRIGGYLVEAASFFGVPTFLLKTGGMIVAIFFLPYWGPRVQEEVKSAIVMSHDYWIGPFQNLAKQEPEEPATRYAIVTQNSNTVAQAISIYQTGSFPSGTQLFPVSGIPG